MIEVPEGGLEVAYRRPRAMVSGLEVTYCPKAIIRPRAMVYSFYLIQQTIYRVDRKKSLLANLYSKKASKKAHWGQDARTPHSFLSREDHGLGRC